MSNARMIGANNERVTDSHLATKVSKEISNRKNGDNNE